VTTSKTIATEIADRFFGERANAAAGLGKVRPLADALAAGTCPPEGGRYTAADAVKRIEIPAKAAVEIQVFVSENDVRRAMTRSEKIYIGRKTILTPSARDLGMEHEVFVETEAGSIR
jgi:hypothetical protein